MTGNTTRVSCFSFFFPHASFSFWKTLKVTEEEETNALSVIAFGSFDLALSCSLRCT